MMYQTLCTEKNNSSKNYFLQLLQLIIFVIFFSDAMKIK